MSAGICRERGRDRQRGAHGRYLVAARSCARATGQPQKIPGGVANDLVEEQAEQGGCRRELVAVPAAVAVGAVELPVVVGGVGSAAVRPAGRSSRGWSCRPTVDSTRRW